MNNIKVRTKMIITGMITAIGMLLLFILMLFSINNLEAISTRKLRDSLKEDYDTKIKEQVESVLKNCTPEKVYSILLPVMTVMSTNTNTILNILHK